MSSVEGMWLMRSSEIEDQVTASAPSVVILETGRIFGGDSAYYFVGDYKFEAGTLSGFVRSRTHTIYEEGQNVFGMTGHVDYTVDFSAEAHGDVLSGIMYPRSAEHFAVWFHMTRLADLPG